MILKEDSFENEPPLSYQKFKQAAAYFQGLRVSWSIVVGTLCTSVDFLSEH